VRPDRVPHGDETVELALRDGENLHARPSLARSSAEE
jgi:hypothetical protein